jgi:hypothetical protein
LNFSTAIWMNSAYLNTKFFPLDNHVQDRQCMIVPDFFKYGSKFPSEMHYFPNHEPKELRYHFPAMNKFERNVLCVERSRFCFCRILGSPVEIIYLSRFTKKSVR